MSKEKIVVNGIIYFIITFFVLFLLFNEKSINESVDKLKEDFVYKRFNIDISNRKGYIIDKFLDFLEALITAFVLVLFIQKFYLGNFLVPTESMYPTIKPNDRIFGNMLVYNFKNPSRDEIIVFREPMKDKVLFTKRVMGMPGDMVRIKGEKLYINEELWEDRPYISAGTMEESLWRVPKKGDLVRIECGIKELEGFLGGSLDVELIQNQIKKGELDVSQLPQIDFYIDGQKTGMLYDLIHHKEILEPLLGGKSVTLRLEQDYYFVLGDNTEGSLDSRIWGFVARERIKGRPFVKFWPLSSFGRLE